MASSIPWCRPTILVPTWPTVVVTVPVTKFALSLAAPAKDPNTLRAPVVGASVNRAEDNAEGPPFFCASRSSAILWTPGLPPAPAPATRGKRKAPARLPASKPGGRQYRGDRTAVWPEGEPGSRWRWPLRATPAQGSRWPFFGGPFGQHQPKCTPGKPSDDPTPRRWVRVNTWLRWRAPLREGKPTKTPVGYVCCIPRTKSL